MKQRPTFTAIEFAAVYFAPHKAGYDPGLVEEITDKIQQLVDFRPKSRGRPAKLIEQTADARRAQIVDHWREKFPDLSKTEALEFAKHMADLFHRFYNDAELRSWVPLNLLAEIDTDGPEWIIKIRDLLSTDHISEMSLRQSISRGRRIAARTDDNH